jgi:hypothetical protein
MLTLPNMNHARPFRAKQEKPQPNAVLDYLK